MSSLEIAIKLAVDAHQGQRDKAGRAYILHPLKVMLQMSSEEEMIVAVLHDIVEDTDYTLDMLQELGFAHEIIAAIDCLTRRDNEPYDAFIARIKTHEIARKVKLADIEDNIDITRLSELRERDLDRLKRYHRAWRQLNP
jgi:(p)ppGpp synthase/HD superfamily hydrolase